MLKDKVKELERWLILLLNNFYEGNPTSLKNIEQVVFSLKFRLLGIATHWWIESGEVLSAEIGSLIAKTEQWFTKLVSWIQEANLS